MATGGVSSFSVPHRKVAAPGTRQHFATQSRAQASADKLRQQRGMVTAEFAVSLLALALIVGVLGSGLMIAFHQYQAQSLAWQAGRELARGANEAMIAQQVRQRMPNAQLNIADRGEQTQVQIRYRYNVVGLRPVVLSASAVAPTERRLP